MFIRFMFILVNAVKMRFHVIGVIVRNVIDWRTGLWHNNGGLPVDFRCFNYCVRLWKREISFDVSGLAFSFIFTSFSFPFLFFSFLISEVHFLIIINHPWIYIQNVETDRGYMIKYPKWRRSSNYTFAVNNIYLIDSTRWDTIQK